MKSIGKSASFLGWVKSFFNFLIIERFQRFTGHSVLISLTQNSLTREFQKIKPFNTIDFLRYTLQTSENFWFSDVFRGYRKRPVT